MLSLCWSFKQHATLLTIINATLERLWKQADLRKGTIFPANILEFNGNNKNTRKRCKICSGVFTITLSIFHTFSSVAIVHFEQVNVCQKFLKNIFYPLPKTHEKSLNVCSRPVIFNSSYYMVNVSYFSNFYLQWLEHAINPLMHNVPKWSDTL